MDRFDTIRQEATARDHVAPIITSVVVAVLLVPVSWVLATWHGGNPIEAGTQERPTSMICHFNPVTPPPGPDPASPMRRISAPATADVAETDEAEHPLPGVSTAGRFSVVARPSF